MAAQGAAVRARLSGDGVPFDDGRLYGQGAKVHGESADRDREGQAEGGQTDSFRVPDHSARAYRDVSSGDGQQVNGHQGDCPGPRGVSDGGRIPFAAKTFGAIALPARTLLDVDQSVRAGRETVPGLCRRVGGPRPEAVCPLESGDHLFADEARAGVVCDPGDSVHRYVEWVLQSVADGRILLCAGIEFVPQECIS